MGFTPRRCERLDLVRPARPVTSGAAHRQLSTAASVASTAAVKTSSSASSGWPGAVAPDPRGRRPATLKARKISPLIASSVVESLACLRVEDMGLVRTRPQVDARVAFGGEPGLAAGDELDLLAGHVGDAEDLRTGADLLDHRDACR